MKPRCSKQGNQAFTLIELLVVIAVLAIFFALIDFGPPPSAKRKAQRIACMSNLKEISTAARLWTGDHIDKYPMAASVTNGGIGEPIVPGKAYILWQTLSNQLGSPRTLWCPADVKTVTATDFSTGLGDVNISYFIALDAADAYPQMILDGDDNLLVDGRPVQPGILNLRTNQTIAWTKDRHRNAGNIGLADGSVQQITNEGFQHIEQVTLGTNSASGRWLIP